MTTTHTATELPFRLREPQSHRALTLVPLHPTVEPLEYIGLDEAAAGGLVVTEVDHGGDVNLLQIENPLPVHVLIYEGEALAGAKQNRIVRFSTLLPPDRKVPVPVDCVERGRWAYRGLALVVVRTNHGAERQRRHVRPPGPAQRRRPPRPSPRPRRAVRLVGDGCRNEAEARGAGSGSSARRRRRR